MTWIPSGWGGLLFSVTRCEWWRWTFLGTFIVTAKMKWIKHENTETFLRTLIIYYPESGLRTFSRASLHKRTPLLAFWCWELCFHLWWTQSKTYLSLWEYRESGKFSVLDSTLLVCWILLDRWGLLPVRSNWPQYPLNYRNVVTLDDRKGEVLTTFLFYCRKYVMFWNVQYSYFRRYVYRSWFLEAVSPHRWTPPTLASSFLRISDRDSSDSSAVFRPAGEKKKKKNNVTRKVFEVR